MRGASEHSEDKQAQTPQTIAASQQNSQTLRYFKKEITDQDLAGVQPADIESLRAIKENFVDGVEVIKSKLDLLRQELKVASSVEEATLIMKKIRIVKLALCFDS